MLVDGSVDGVERDQEAPSLVVILDGKEALAGPTEAEVSRRWRGD